MTTSDILATNWQMLRGRAQQRWYSLTDEDIREINGSYDALVNALQKRYFYGRQTAERDINQFLNEFVASNRPVRAWSSRSLGSTS